MTSSNLLSNGSSARALLAALLIAPALLTSACAPGSGEPAGELSSKGSDALSDAIYTVDGWMSLEDEYIPRVCTQENGGAGSAALEAQAVAARTYLATAIGDHPTL